MSWWSNVNHGSDGRSGAGGAQHDLRLQLAPPAGGIEVDGSDSSSPSSCVSSDGSSGNKSRMLIGVCSRCKRYCMVSMKEFPTCVHCKQPYLADVFHGPATTAAIAARKLRQPK